MDSMNSWMEIWRHLPEKISPIFFKLGMVELRWYGLCYFLAILTSFLLISWRIRRKETALRQSQLEDYYFWVIFGVVIGARLGYVFFYQWAYYAEHPSEIFLPFRWENGFHFTGISGLSFHGGWIGSIMATWLFCRRNQIRFWDQLDLIVPSVPAGYMFGRLGNFLNGELWGRTTDSAIGMIFPQDLLQAVRHPSQLYEMLGEGLLLFLILWPLRNKKFFPGWLFCAYAFGYGIIRFCIEYFREPDAQLGLLNAGLSMGQWLCLSMVVFSFVLGSFLFWNGQSDNGMRRAENGKRIH